MLLLLVTLATLGANRVLLPLSTGASCLDGSPYAFYLAANRSSTRWSIYFRGGGWCYNETLCEDRAYSKLGTSTLQPAVGDCECAYFYDDGMPDEEQCNCVSLVYCDGASFSGHRAQPWPIPTPRANVTHLHFRGLRNLNATLDYLAANAGFANATEVVVTGGSAGGLSTFLHADRIAGTCTSHMIALFSTLRGDTACTLLRCRLVFNGIHRSLSILSLLARS